MSTEMPKHVKEYLADQGVEESDLTDKARDTFASLSGGEIALLRKLDKSLEDVDTQVVAKVH